MSRRRSRPPPDEAPLAGVSTDAILESISDGVFTVDAGWRITTFNRAAEQITGVSRAEAIGQRCSEVFRASMCEESCALRQTIETGQPVVNAVAFIVDTQGRRIPISVSTALLRDRSGRVAGGAETFRDLTLIEELRRKLDGRGRVGDLVSRSAAMRRIFDILPLVAESESTILIQGETGTGKELLARAIHDLSPRRNGPFVAVNCGALPDTLLESELFGYKAGAFTGAARDKPGRFALAEGGTLLLDEIGEVSPALQVRLLRVLQERAYEPLGGTAPVASDVRVVASTNRDLAALVERGDFRQDLFYRVQVMKIDLPPLRKRREDIPLLVEHFVAQLNAVQGKHVEGVSADVLAVLVAHDFPGNVRELRNVLERAFILRREGRIELCHLPVEMVPQHPPPGTRIAEAVRVVEAQSILAALERNGNSRLAAARELGMNKSTLFRKAKLLGIKLPPTDGRSRRSGR